MSTISMQPHGTSVKRAAWTVAVFYILIAFEFFYMASPFAIYFYSVCRPGLNFLNQVPGAAWLTSFFLPHIVAETSSTLVNLHNVVGAVLAILGFVTFCVGAGQVYYYRLTRKGAVTGGIYNIIRHPQYASFALCSFGLLLLWPRYIVLVMFMTMLFAYYFLAKVEERECEEKFGQSYIDYKNRTNMFLPFRIPLTEKLPNLPQSRLKKALSIAALYVLTVLVSLGLARGIQSLALDSLYALYSKDSAYISVSKIKPETMEKLVAIALANEDVQTKLGDAKDSTNTKFLNYVLPAEWYVSEIPMNVVEGSPDHFLRSDDYDKSHYKIIFTKADLRTDRHVEGKELLLNTVKRIPIVEVWLDLSQSKVNNVQNPPATMKYENTPVPVY
ncbi:MAG: isoprenylcysteine carboxylmethyltransferase family protein [Deltaproteobacteria bacterium]|nr:MAG: isoprenylcysteine carboxylmethyltransferase family protein [Deltaproteobacteria bacterium]